MLNCLAVVDGELPVDDGEGSLVCELLARSTATAIIAAIRTMLTVVIMIPITLLFPVLFPWGAGAKYGELLIDMATIVVCPRLFYKDQSIGSAP